MEDLIMKNISFHDSVICTAMDLNGEIFIDIFQVSREIGLGAKQAEQQVEICKNNIWLNQGYHMFDKGAFNPRYEVQALKLSYLTVWLSNIIPYKGTVEHNPDIINRLAMFEQELEDTILQSYNTVLLKDGHNVIKPKKRGRPLDSEKDLLNEVKEIHNRMDGLYFDFNKFVSFMFDWKNSVEEMMNLYSVVMNNISYYTTKEERKWKKHIYDLVEKMIKPVGEFDGITEALGYAYSYLNRNYGIVWEQEYKEYMEENGMTVTPPKIDIICKKEQYRTLLEAILIDKISEQGIVLDIKTGDLDEEQQKNIDDCKFAYLDELVKPLAEKNGDNSCGYNATYKKIYKHMAYVYKVSWKNQITRFKNEKVTDNEPSKREVIMSKMSLRKKFEKSVKDLLQETNNSSIETKETVNPLKKVNNYIEKQYQFVEDMEYEELDDYLIDSQISLLSE